MKKSMLHQLRMYITNSHMTRVAGSKQPGPPMPTTVVMVPTPMIWSMHHGWMEPPNGGILAPMTKLLVTIPYYC